MVVGLAEGLGGGGGGGGEGKVEAFISTLATFELETIGGGGGGGGGNDDK